MPTIATVQVFDGFLQSLNVGHGESLAGTFISNPDMLGNHCERNGASYNATGGKESNSKISEKPNDDKTEEEDY
jgi:hypothetical protein